MIWKFIRDYKLLYLLPLLLFFALVYKFYLSQGTYYFFDYNQGRFYNWLAQGFLEGKFGVASNVVRSHPGGFGDGIYLNGNIFLPWGPFPAIIHAIAIIFTGSGILSSTQTYLFSIVNLVIFWLLCIRISKKIFGKTLSKIVIPIFFSYAAGAIMFNIGRGYVYEESIIVASTLLLASLLTLTYLENQEKKKLRLFLAGLLFGLAIFTRFNYVMFGPLLLLYILFFTNTQLSLKPIIKSAGLMIAFLLPVFLIITIQFAYNYQRFGSFFEFGNRFQAVANLDVKPRLNQLFSLSYIPYNFINYFAAPTLLLPNGRFFYGDFPGTIGNFPKIPPTEYTSSIFLGAPILIFYLFSLVYLLKRRNKDLSGFIISSHLGIWFFLIFGLLMFLGNGMRYTQDFIPIFYLVAMVSIYPILTGAKKIVVSSIVLLLFIMSFYTFGVTAKKTCYAWVGGPKGVNTKECRKLYRPVNEFIQLS